jgi:2-oxo-4-hydroxy-4-carboxy-5-ureidoimidazoline decarboxylase
MKIATALNALDEAAARDALQKCCAAPAWIEQMLAHRPFADDKAVETAAVAIWWSLPHDEWHAAFAAHPKIGDVNSLKKKYASTSTWASNEQASVAQASDDTLQELARYNQDYEAKFGYIFIVCATGKSAAEMLAILKSRIGNDPAAELKIAAAEQLKITLLRLAKLAGTA